MTQEYLLLFLALLSNASAGVFVAPLKSKMSGFLLIALRAPVSTAVFVAAFALRGTSLWPADGDRLASTEMILVIVLGALGSLSFGILLQSAPIWCAFIAGSMLPAIVLLMRTMWSGVRPSRFEAAAIVLVLAGASLALREVSKVKWWIPFFSFTNIACYGGYTYFSSQVSRPDIGLLLSNLLCIPGGVFLYWFCKTAGKRMRVPAQLSLPLQRMSASDHASLLGLSVFQHALPLLVFAMIIKDTGAAVIGFASATTPIVASIVCAVMGRGDWPNLRAWIGILSVFAGVILVLSQR